MKIINELSLVTNFRGKLPLKGFYLAGLARSKSRAPLKEILRQISHIYNKAEEGILKESSVRQLEIKLYNGEIDHLDAFVDSLESSFRQASQEAEKQFAELDRQITQIMTQIEEQEQSFKRAEMCILCKQSTESKKSLKLEICEHLYHNACLNLVIEDSISSIDILCKVNGCDGILTYQDIEAAATPQVFREYEKNYLQSLRSSGAYGSTETCWKCGNSLIRGNNCLRCDTSVSSKPCPSCKMLVRQEESRIVRCENCKTKFCFHCAALLTKCECASKSLLAI